MKQRHGRLADGDRHLEDGKWIKRESWIVQLGKGRNDSSKIPNTASSRNINIRKTVPTPNTNSEMRGSKYVIKTCVCVYILYNYLHLTGHGYHTRQERRVHVFKKRVISVNKKLYFFKVARGLSNIPSSVRTNSSVTCHQLWVTFAPCSPPDQPRTR